ncbi:rRNA biogenesis protein rrp36, partial [Clydaea vesicula]
MNQEEDSSDFSAEETYDSSHSESESVEDKSDKLQHLKEQLKNVSFDKLIEIKSKISKSEFDILTKRNEKGFEKDGKSSKQKVTKRVDKNAPTEVTSKRQVKRFRNVVDVKKKVVRDPRFDPSTGKFNPDLFNRSYGFVNDLEAKELAKLKEEVKKKKLKGLDVEELQKAIQKLESKRISKEKSEALNSIKRNWKKSETELVKKGKNPYYLKKGEVKKLELVEQFKSMKDKDMDKFLQKRRQRNAAKEHR